MVYGMLYVTRDGLLDEESYEESYDILLNMDGVGGIWRGTNWVGRCFRLLLITFWKKFTCVPSCNTGANMIVRRSVGKRASQCSHSTKI